MSDDALKLAEYLKEAHLTVATAESCTGGLIASEFVSIAGSSEWFAEGCVTYSVGAKVSRLGVSPETVERYTVVSAEVAKEMAHGVRRNLNADIGVSTTGYAGPTGGDEKNPVGTVYVGISSEKTGEIAFRLSLSGSRNEIREKAKEEAIRLLWEALVKIS